MKTTHIILLTVTTEKDVKDLPKLIEQRAWSIDGVHQKNLDATLLRSFPADNVDESDICLDLTIADDGAIDVHIKENV